MVWVVGAHGQLTQSAILRNPRTKYKRSKNVFSVIHIALIIGRDWPRLLQPLAQSLIGSPGTIPGAPHKSKLGLRGDWGDGRKQKRGTKPKELVHLFDPGVLEKYFFHQKWRIINPSYPETRNSWHSKIKYKYESIKKTFSHSIKSKYAPLQGYLL